MKGRAIKPLALLVSVMALGLSATQPVLAAEAQYQVGHTFSDSLDTTVRPCTSSRCDIGGGFDWASTPSGNSGAGGGWANQQETIRLSAAQPNGNSGAGGGRAKQQEEIRFSAAQPVENSGSGGGWANQQEIIYLSASQGNTAGGGGGGWIK